jgi:methanethiol S-methyltransferase
MTLGHLLFAVTMSGYMLVAIQLEERDLVRHHGQRYARYQEQVPMLVPLPSRRFQEERQPEIA